MVITEAGHKVSIAEPRRRFTTLDGMVLIAASAPGLSFTMRLGDDWIGCLRCIEPGLLLDEHHSILIWPEMARLLASTFRILMPYMVFWSFAVFALRWRRPCPALGDLARQPGVWACGTSVLTLFAWNCFTRDGAFPYPFIVPASVLLAWLGLVLSRRWRSEASWIDRVGRAIGVCWLASAFFHKPYW
jgi:hypothetical protein